MCPAGRYASTLHAISAALRTLSTLAACRTVYRGVSGGLLPAAFTAPDADTLFRGGVEFGFMSTTLDRELAVEYASGEGGGRQGLIFEIQQGMVDKGASLKWLSQVHARIGQGRADRQSQLAPACGCACMRLPSSSPQLQSHRVCLV